ncbi:MAG TPA: GNAT family N-acetyltransferase [Polyangiaceae bacterium]
MQTPPQVELGLAASEDLPQLVALLSDLFTQEADFTPRFERQSVALRAILASPASGRIHVARFEGQCVGMVNLLETISTAEGCPAVWLEDMVIAREWRGQGLGSRLLESAMLDCQQRGITRITLLTDEDNLDAQRFYTRHGFARSKMVAYRKYLGE